MPIWQLSRGSNFSIGFVIQFDARFRLSRPLGAFTKRHWMSEFYVVAGIIVVLGLAVMFIISKVQE
jgi:hypothetical protein